MSLSQPHPERPYEQTGVKLGDEQFAHGRRVGGGRPAGAGRHRRRARACPTSSRATPPTTCSRDRRDRRPGRRQPRPSTATTSRRRSPSGRRSRSASTRRSSGRRTAAGSPPQPFSEPEVFDFPEGIGPVECVNVEHEEVLLIPRWVDARRVTFKYGLGDEFIDVLQTLHKLGLDRTDDGPRRRRVEVSPARRGAAVPARPGRPRRPDARQDLRRAPGSRGTGKDGAPREVYLYHVVDNEWSMARVRLPGGRVADRRQPGRRARAARRRRVDGRRRARARRRSTPCRSSTCSPPTARPGACARAADTPASRIFRGAKE